MYNLEKNRQKDCHTCTYSLYMKRRTFLRAVVRITLYYIKHSVSTHIFAKLYFER